MDFYFHFHFHFSVTEVDQRQGFFLSDLQFLYVPTIKKHSYAHEAQATQPPLLKVLSKAAAEMRRGQRLNDKWLVLLLELL